MRTEKTSNLTMNNSEEIKSENYPEDSFNENSSSSSSTEKSPEISKTEKEAKKKFQKAQFFPKNHKQGTSINPNSLENSQDIFNFTISNLRYIEIAVKLFAVFILMIFIWYFGTSSGKHRNDPNFCLDDKGHDYLDGLNFYIHHHPSLRHFFEITSSFSMDTVLLNLLALFLFYGKDGYPFYMVVFFYGPRGVIQNIFTFKFPKTGFGIIQGFHPSLFLTV